MLDLIGFLQNSYDQNRFKALEAQMGLEGQILSNPQVQQQLAALEELMGGTTAQSWLAPLDGISRAAGAVADFRNPFAAAQDFNAPALSQVLDEKGAPAWASYGSEFILPDGMGPVDEALAMLPLLRMLARGENGLPTTIYRAESADGTGPLASYHQTKGDFQPGVTYWSQNPDIPRILGTNDPNLAEAGRVVRAQVSTRPGGLLDVTGDTEIDPEVWQRFAQAALNQPMSDEARDMLVRRFGQVERGEAPAYEVISDLRAIHGRPLGSVPADAGIDVIRQFPDDNYIEAVRGAQPIDREYLVFNRDSTLPLSTDSFPEFTGWHRGADVPLGPAPRPSVGTPPVPIDPFQATLDGGGLTFNPRTRAAKTGGYAYSPYKEFETTIPADQFSPQMLADFEAKHADLLSDPDNFLGTWFDTKNNTYVLDVSTVIDDLDEATKRAIAANQDALFDLNTFEEIRLR